MAICSKCNKEFDEKLAQGICPHCGAVYVEKSNENNKEKDDPRWLPVGTMLNGRYRVEKVIGAGGFGITYRALDHKTGIKKAVKEYFQSGVVNRIPGTTQVLIAAPKRHEEFVYGRERLLREAQIVAKFQSAGIVRVDDYFEENGTSYMVMEYLDSQTLEDYLVSQRRLMTPDEAVKAGVRIAEALEEIHRAGVVHRDIAPDNIFIDSDGDVKIIDFGSARLSKEDTDDRLIVLKPGFAPPEQYEKIDPKNDRQKGWTDVYALGATLYLCLTGKIPPESSDRKADADRGEDRLQPPMEINQNIPEWLNNTILTAMAIDTHERFKDASELKAALLQERKVLPIEKVRRRKRLRRTTGIAVSFVIVAVLAAFGIRRYYSRREQAVLDAASIEIWYAVSAEDEAGEKAAKLQTIQNALNDSEIFSDIEITLVDIPEQEYAARISEAAAEGSLPNLFEYRSGIPDCMDAGGAIEQAVSDTKDDCYFLDDYKKAYPETDRLPTSFNIPIIYINSALADDYGEEMSFGSMESLFVLCHGNLMYSTICIKPELRDDYETMLEDLKSVESEGDLTLSEGIEDFLNSEAAVYFGDSTDYIKARSALGASVKMEPVAVSSVVCRYSNEWCMRSVDEAADAAAEAILEYFLSNYSQDNLFLQTSIPGLPLEKISLDSYSEVKRPFEELLSDSERKKFTFRAGVK